ncbi:MAG: stage V sporulation protein AC [Methylocystaceae bacterium]
MVKTLDNDYLKVHYQQVVDEVKPKPPVFKNCCWAFVVGGAICLLGQLIINFLQMQGVEKEAASNWNSIILIGLGALLTGLGVYDELGKRAGAGSIVPITGFSNSIVAAAMEYKREGYVFGVGARMYTIAGPVLVFGFTISFVIGLIKMLAIMLQG